MTLEAKVSSLEAKLGAILQKLSSAPPTTSVSSGSVSTQAKPVASDLNLAKQIKSALKEQAEEDVISRSLIISGVAEEANSKDLDSVLDLVHAAASVPLLPADIESLSRLGKQQPSHPRLLRVVLNAGSKHFRNEIVSKSQSLRKSTDPSMKKIFINPDKTKSALKEEYELRCELRRRRSAGEEHLFIKNGEIVHKQESGRSADTENSSSVN